MPLQPFWSKNGPQFSAHVNIRHQARGIMHSWTTFYSAVLSTLHVHIKYIDPQTYALFVAFKRLQIYTFDNISEATFFNSVFHINSSTGSCKVAFSFKDLKNILSPFFRYLFNLTATPIWSQNRNTCSSLQKEKCTFTLIGKKTIRWEPLKIKTSIYIIKKKYLND